MINHNTKLRRTVGEIASNTKANTGKIARMKLSFNRQPYANTQLAISTIIRWFNLTDVSANPMTGTMQRWASEAGTPSWIDHNIIDADIYPHPGNDNSSYSKGLYPCVYVGNQWFVVSGSGGGDRWAFCKVAAGTGSTLACYLGTDETGEEITVNFELLNCSNLSDGHLTLVDGSRIRVAKDGDDWWCVTPIEGSEDCS